MVSSSSTVMPRFAGVDEVGEEAIDGVVDGEVSAVDGDADEQRDEALRGGLHVGGAVRPRAVEVLLDEQRPVHRDEQRPHARQVGDPRQNRLERRIGLDAAGASGAGRAEQGETGDGRRAGSSVPTRSRPAVLPWRMRLNPSCRLSGDPRRAEAVVGPVPGPCSVPSPSDPVETAGKPAPPQDTGSKQTAAILPLSKPMRSTAARRALCMTGLSSPAPFRNRIGSAAPTGGAVERT